MQAGATRYNTVCNVRLSKINRLTTCLVRIHHSDKKIVDRKC